MSGLPNLAQVALYYDPVDYPGKWVVRRWYASATEVVPAADCLVFDDRPSNVDANAEGLIWLPRLNCDDPKIVGVWI